MWERRAQIKDRLLNEHRKTESLLLPYMELVLGEYEKELERYSGDIGEFIANVEEHWYPHVEFEEKEVLPAIFGHPIVNELLAEHKKIKELIEKAKRVKSMGEKVAVLRELVLAIKNHIKKENDVIPGLLY